ELRRVLDGMEVGRTVEVPGLPVERSTHGQDAQRRPRRLAVAGEAETPPLDPRPARLTLVAVHPRLRATRPTKNKKLDLHALVDEVSDVASVLETDIRFQGAWFESRLGEESMDVAPRETAADQIPDLVCESSHRYESRLHHVAPPLLRLPGATDSIEQV